MSVRQVNTYSVKKAYVRFQCPKCGECLNTNLIDAGTQDACPCCSTAFIAPGVKELAEFNKRQNEKAQEVAAAVEAKHQRIQERSEAKYRKVPERSEAKLQKAQERPESDIQVEQVRAQIAEQGRTVSQPRKAVTTIHILSKKPRSWWSKKRTFFAVAVALVAWFSLGIIVVQPIGAIPQGATVVYFRFGLNLPFVSSPDGLLIKSGSEVSLFGRAAALAAMADVIKERKIVSLPYSRTLYVWSTGGKEYEQ